MHDFGGNYILFLNKPRTTSHGFSSFSYVSAKLGNALSDFIRTTEFTSFKRESRAAFCRAAFFLIKTFLNIVYLVMYLYMLCILSVNVKSRIF